VEEVHNHLRVSRGLEAQRASGVTGETSTTRTAGQGATEPSQPSQPGQRVHQGTATQPGTRPH
jgi:hypothetical protein